MSRCSHFCFNFNVWGTSILLHQTSKLTGFTFNIILTFQHYCQSYIINNNTVDRLRYQQCQLKPAKRDVSPKPPISDLISQILRRDAPAQFSKHLVYKKPNSCSEATTRPHRNIHTHDRRCSQADSPGLQCYQYLSRLNYRANQMVNRTTAPRSEKKNLQVSQLLSNERRLIEGNAPQNKYVTIVNKTTHTKTSIIVIQSETPNRFLNGQPPPVNDEQLLLLRAHRTPLSQTVQGNASPGRIPYSTWFHLILQLPLLPECDP